MYRSWVFLCSFSNDMHSLNHPGILPPNVHSWVASCKNLPKFPLQKDSLKRWLTFQENVASPNERTILHRPPVVALTWPLPVTLLSVLRVQVLAWWSSHIVTSLTVLMMNTAWIESDIWERQFEPSPASWLLLIMVNMNVIMVNLVREIEPHHACTCITQGCIAML